MITVGNTGQQWRASVTPWGGLVPWDDSPPINWYVAADDRWHIPADEPAVRQQRVGGVAVVETRVRVPNGDVVQRIYSTANDGGITLIEVENESTMPTAVAFDRRGVLTERPISNTPIEGIDLPAGSFVLPLGHAATLRIGIPHSAPRDGTLPRIPPAEQVVRGWLTIAERPSRFVLPDGEQGASLVERVLAERCEMVLGTIPHADDDPAGCAVAVDQLVRMGEVADHWVPELVDAVERLGPHESWAADAALRSAERVLVAAGERRAVNDLSKIIAERARSLAPATAPDGPLAAAWIDERFADGGRLLPGGIPEAWYGQSFETYGVPTAGDGAVSFGVRWHGEHPAVLWEQTGTPVELTAPDVAPGWSTTDPKGETLWT